MVFSIKGSVAVIEILCGTCIQAHDSHRFGARRVCVTLRSAAFLPYIVSDRIAVVSQDSTRSTARGPSRVSGTLRSLELLRPLRTGLARLSIAIELLNCP